MSEPLTAIILTYNEAGHTFRACAPGSGPITGAYPFRQRRRHSRVGRGAWARVLSRPFTNWPEQRNYAL